VIHSNCAGETEEKPGIRERIMAEHDHTHPGDHAQAHVPPNITAAFAIGVALNLGFVVVEGVYGLLANSMALIADAGHNLGDVLGLVIAWIATVLARRAPSQNYTYGLRRATILAALVNAMLLLVAVGAITIEGIRRLSEPGEIASVAVMAVAAAGIVVNGITAWLLASGRRDDSICGVPSCTWSTMHWFRLA
jgi:cobalt-zinc-cadmium efflux system protein